GFVPLPRRWVVARRTAWPARRRRLARAYARLPEPRRGPHALAFALLLLARFVALLPQSAQQALGMHRLGEPIGAPTRSPPTSRPLTLRRPARPPLRTSTTTAMRCSRCTRCREPAGS